MLFVQFYLYRTVAEGVKLPEKVVGAVFEIETSKNPQAIHELAVNGCKKRGYDAWRIFKGDSIANAKPVSCIYKASCKEDETAFSAYHGA